MKTMLTIPQQIMQKKTKQALDRLKQIIKRQHSLKKRADALDYRIRFILYEIQKLKKKWGIV